MSKFGLALVLAIAFVSYASSLEMFSVDCDGGIRMFPTFPIAMQLDFSAITGVAETFLSVYKDRLKCLCSGLTDEEFNRLFHPFFGADMLFNMIQGPDADLAMSSCDWSAFDNVDIRVDKFNQYMVDLTETCSYATWKNDGKCLLQSQAFSDWDVTVKGALFRCPNAPWRPAVSVVCEGTGCDQAFIPCMSNNDCAGDMTCQKFMIDGAARPSNEDIISAFRTMLFAEDTPSSCINSGDFIRKTIDIVRKLWKKGSADYTLSQLQFCSPIQLDFATNSTFDWEGFLHYSNETVDITNNSIALPGYLQPWNGQLLSGGSVTPPQNVGSKPSTDGAITQGATLMLKKTCDGMISALPTSGYGFQFNLSWTQDWINHWVSTVMSVLKCRFNAMGVSISDQEIITRWGLGLDVIFFSTDASTKDDPIVREDIRDYQFNMDTRLNYPESCNYDTWVNSGSCRASYTGFSNLLGVDITFNMELLKCPGTQDFSATVECVGEACALISGKSKPCNSDADCPNSLSCKDLNPKLSDYDWIADYIGLNRYNETNQQCSRNADQIHAETRKLILSYWNMPFDGSSDNKYCMIDFDHVDSQTSTWLNGEVETTAPGVVTLKNLQSWGYGGKVPSWAPSVASAMNVLLIISTIIVNALL